MIKYTDKWLDEEMHRTRSGRVLSSVLLELGCVTLLYVDMFTCLEALGNPTTEILCRILT